MKVDVLKGQIKNGEKLFKNPFTQKNVVVNCEASLITENIAAKFSEKELGDFIACLEYSLKYAYNKGKSSAKDSK